MSYVPEFVLSQDVVLNVGDVHAQSVHRRSVRPSRLKSPRIEKYLRVALQSWVVEEVNAPFMPAKLPFTEKVPAPLLVQSTRVPREPVSAANLKSQSMSARPSPLKSPTYGM